MSKITSICKCKKGIRDNTPVIELVVEEQRGKTNRTYTYFLSIDQKTLDEMNKEMAK